MYKSYNILNSINYQPVTAALMGEINVIHLILIPDIFQNYVFGTLKHHV